MPVCLDRPRFRLFAVPGLSFAALRLSFAVLADETPGVAQDRAPTNTKSAASAMLELVAELLG